MVVRVRQGDRCAVIFDNDGVIIDSEPLFDEATLEMWRRRKIRLPRGYGSFVVRRVKGVSEAMTFRRFKLFLRLPDSVPALIAERQRIVGKLFERRLRLMPGVRSLVRQLRRRFSLGVASSSPAWRIRQGLRRYGLLKYFKTVVSVDHLRGRGKPHPAIYLHTARRLGILPSRCVVIEDAPNGVIAAKRAGMACIALKHPTVPRRTLRRADVIVSSLTQITPKLIQRLAAE